ncbi:MAG: hypothetical protein ACYCW7_06385 [Pseudomonadaceae bacterium]
MLIEFGGPRQQRRQREQQQKKEPHVASLTQIEDTTDPARGYRRGGRREIEVPTI